MIEIWTDGACKGNPGPGGFGLACFRKENETCDLIFAIHKSANNTTNNREELKAIIVALEWIKEQELYESVTIYSDSSYCVNMTNNWIHSWAMNNWVRANKKVVENIDLVKHLYSLITELAFKFQIVQTRGHCGIWENELVDALATGNDRKMNQVLKEADINEVCEILFFDEDGFCKY